MRSARNRSAPLPATPWPRASLKGQPDLAYAVDRVIGIKDRALHRACPPAAIPALRLSLSRLAGGVVLSLLPLAAFAQVGPLDEVRLGVLAHDVLPVYRTHHEDGVDLNGELYFVSPVPDRWLSDVRPSLRWLLQPRPSLGVDANTVGATSQVYVSAVWSVDLNNGGALWPDGTVFMDFGAGPAYNTGHVATQSRRYLSLGSNLLFHLSVDLGVRLTRVLSASVYFEHSSNAGLAAENPGLNNVGLRMGIRF